MKHTIRTLFTIALLLLVSGRCMAGEANDPVKKGLLMPNLASVLNSPAGEQDDHRGS